MVYCRALQLRITSIQHAKDRYDRAVAWLKQLAKGEINLEDLPLLEIGEQGANSQQISKNLFIFGSREKFNHE